LRERKRHMVDTFLLWLDQSVFDTLCHVIPQCEMRKPSVDDEALVVIILQHALELGEFDNTDDDMLARIRVRSRMLERVLELDLDDDELHLGGGHAWIASDGGRALDDVLERRLVPRFLLEFAEGGDLCVFVGCVGVCGCIDQTGWKLYDVFIERGTILLEDDGRERESVGLGLEDGEDGDGVSSSVSWYEFAFGAFPDTLSAVLVLVVDSGQGNEPRVGIVEGFS